MNDTSNKIKQILKKQIRLNGAISLAEYIRICLTHPKYGYYIKNNPIGANGDFTTSPEISQMFGELIGLWIAQVWLDYKKPEKLSLVELGPGNGTLMADIMRSTRMIEGFHSALDLILVEISPHLQKIQKESLKGFSVEWKTKIEMLPNQPTIVIANEFFDALPIKQFKKTSNQWLEIMVTMKDFNITNSEEFCLHFNKVSEDNLIGNKVDNVKEGDIIEVSEIMKDIVCYISNHIKKNSGAALIVDYGKENNIGDTLQAVRKHVYTDPLRYPGQGDLTSFVDFNAIKTYAKRFELIVPNLVNQGDFLKALGIENRAKILSKKLIGNQLNLHETALQRLIDKDEMGNLFKVLGFRSKNFPPLAGLEI